MSRIANLIVVYQLPHLVLLSAVLAHGRVVTSSRQITEVKQRRARLVLGWVTAA